MPIPAAVARFTKGLRVYRDPDRRGIRRVERAVLGLLDVEEFLELRTV
ncbi:hypothetical protein [Phycicoccus ginsengisoli]